MKAVDASLSCFTLLVNLHFLFVGVVLYVTVAGKLPFDDRSLPRLFNKIAMADYDMPPHLTPELQDLLKKLMCPDPQKRITIPEIHSESWFVRGKGSANTHGQC